MIRAALERAWWSRRPSLVVQWLTPLAWIYGLLWALRARAYRHGVFAVHHARVPVVVVGNLIVGGAGKTPTVIALVDELRARGWTPGVVSRGYGGSASGQPRAVHDVDSPTVCGDEPVLIRRRTRAPVWIGRRRVDTARALCAAHPEVDVIVSDDGLQHLTLARDAQLIVFDDRGVGNGLLLPAGPLREPLTALPPSRTCVIYNAIAATTPWAGAMVSRRITGVTPLSEWRAGRAVNLAAFAAGCHGARVLAVAGIASPERYFAMLEAAGIHIDRLPLPDHASFDSSPWPDDQREIVVTEKDAVKLMPDRPDAGRIHVATLDFKLPADTVDTLHGWLAARRHR